MTKIDTNNVSTKNVTKTKPEIPPLSIIVSRRGSLTSLIYYNRF